MGKKMGGSGMTPRRLSALVLGAALAAPTAGAAVEYNFSWGSPAPAEIYLTFDDSIITNVTYFRDSEVIDEWGSDYSAGSITCKFPGPVDCNDTLSFSSTTHARLSVFGRRLIVSFFGWPPLPAGYEAEGAPIVGGIHDYTGSYLRVTVDKESYYSLWTSNQVTGSVPEPTTWALMIAGFGLAGGTLRARKLARV